MSIDTRMQKNVPLAPRTTLGVGGNAEFFIEVETHAQLVEACAWARKNRKPIHVLGGGSNLLVPDEGVSGLVIAFTMDQIVIQEKKEQVLVTVDAGYGWDAFVEKTVQEGWWGLENLSGIPGLVGAAPIQNINAYGVSVADVIVCVEAYNANAGTQKTFDGRECVFGYRDSIFKHDEGRQYIVTSVTFNLLKQKQTTIEYRSSSQSIARVLEKKGIHEPTPNDVREAVLEVRENIGMLPGMYRSAGSFFKNTIVSSEKFSHVAQMVNEHFKNVSEMFSPWHWVLPDGRVKISTAFLMECTAFNKRTCSGVSYNGVSISPVHTLSLITTKGATANAVRSFAYEIIEEVFKTFEIRIEPEVCMW